DCETDAGRWSATYRCYLRKHESQEGVEEGKVRVICTFLGGAPAILDIAQSDVEAPPPDPRQLAWRLLAQMEMRAGQIGLVPESGVGRLGLIGLPTWMWVEDPGPQTTGPISRSVTTRGYTVSLEASLDRVEYDMGDGTTVTCAGTRAVGTPYRDSYGT